MSWVILLVLSQAKPLNNNGLAFFSYDVFLTFQVFVLSPRGAASYLCVRMQLFDAAGVPLVGGVPKVLSGAFCRAAYVKGYKEELVVIGEGDDVRVERKADLVRAQIPYLVTLVTYRSKLQVQGEAHEYFVYAPADVKSAVQLAYRLWKRWEKLDADADYPKVDDGAVADPIDDALFADMWRYVRRTDKYRAAGHPDDPFAFTAMDPSIKVFRTENFQKGLAVTF